MGDTIVKLTKNIDNISYPAEGYLIQAYWTHQKGEYKKCLDFLLESNEHALKNSNIGQQVYINEMIGILKSTWGQYEDALDILLNQSKLLKKEDKFLEEYREEYYVCLQNLSNTLERVQKNDSASVVIQEGLAISQKNGDSVWYHKFVFGKAVNDFLLKNYNKAYEGIKKARLDSKQSSS